MMANIVAVEHIDGLPAFQQPAFERNSLRLPGGIGLSGSGSASGKTGLAMGGGVPLFHNGECVGAVAVSGIAHDDEPVAEVGAAALRTDS